MRIILIFCVLIISSCHSETSFEFSTYWWKSNTKLNTQQKEFLNDNNIDKIYLRIFDLKFDEKNSSILIPKVYSGFNDINTIPVVYIENKILSNFNIDTIYNLIQQNIKSALEKKIINSANNLQIDCDWTLTTKEPYFQLLNALSKGIKGLSATIRLHQIKYAQTTGIPPVEKGVVMIYNLESPADVNMKNSIFSYDKAMHYLDGYLDKYPLKISIALPAFSWGVHYHHGKIKSLMSDFNPNEIDNMNMSKNKDGYYKSKKAHFYNTHRISNRDEIRYEYPKIEELNKMMTFLLHNIKQDSTEIIFFSLNSNFLTNNKINYEKIISNYK